MEVVNGGKEVTDVQKIEKVEENSVKAQEEEVMVQKIF